ncbi:MAG: helix-turn-helix transcriptional regulator [Ruminococcaceae bacterium]|nr:helix-turn-helix transcriptional regulator [Oscillospiraceae bacterium]
MEIGMPYPIIDIIRTGENIRRLREDRNLTVMEVQSFLRLSSVQAIYQWERGVSLPTVDNLCALSCLFEISMNDILVLTDDSLGEKNRMDHLPKRAAHITKKLLFLMTA